MNTILTKIILIVLISGLIGRVNASEKTESIALFSKYDEDKLAIPYFNREGDLLLEKSNVWTNTNTAQFYQNVEWIWEEFILGESRSAKSVIHTNDGVYVGTWPNAVIYKYDGENYEIEISFADSSQSHVLTLFEATNGSKYAGTLPQVGVKYDAGIYRKLDNDTVWTSLPYLPEGAGSDSVLHNTMVRDIVEDNTGVLYIAVRSIRLYPSGSYWPKAEVWFSTDGGETWFTTGVIGGFYAQYARGLLPVGNNLYVFTGTYSEGEVFKSENKGDIWVKIGGRLYGASTVWTLAANEDGTIFAGANYFYRLKNEGSNGEIWERSPTPDGSDIRVLKIGNDGLLYAGTAKGNIFRTADEGESWELIGALKQQTDSFALSIYDIAEGNGAWYAATAMRPEIESLDYYGTIFKGTEGDVGIAETQLSPPSIKYSVYPNPGRKGSAMRLNIDLPLGTSVIELKIHNVLGQLIKTIDISQIMSGTHTNIAVWDGKNTYGKTVSNGIYFLRMTIVDASGKKISKGIKLMYIY